MWRGTGKVDMQVNTEGWFKCEIEVMVVLFYLLINDNFTGHKGQLFVWNSMRFPFEYRGKYLNGMKSVSSCLPYLFGHTSISPAAPTSVIVGLSNGTNIYPKIFLYVQRIKTANRICRSTGRDMMMWNKLHSR